MQGLELAKYIKENVNMMFANGKHYIPKVVGDLDRWETSGPDMTMLCLWSEASLPPHHYAYDITKRALIIANWSDNHLILDASPYEKPEDHEFPLPMSTTLKLTLADVNLPEIDLGPDPTLHTVYCRWSVQAGMSVMAMSQEEAGYRVESAAKSIKDFDIGYENTVLSCMPGTFKTISQDAYLKGDVKSPDKGEKPTVKETI